jgi:hypothetical protein
LKLLLDTCISVRAKVELKAAGCDAVWAGVWPEDPGEAPGKIRATWLRRFGVRQRAAAFPSELARASRVYLPRFPASKLA